MVSVKLLILVTLFAAVACVPHHEHDHGTIKKTKITFPAATGKIFKDLKPSPRICDADAQKELGKSRHSNDVYDALKLLIQLIQGVDGAMDKHFDRLGSLVTSTIQIVGDVMDNHVDGLGSLVARIGIALARISVCVHGSHKFHEQPYLCYDNFDGIGNDVDEICNGLEVNNAVEQVNTLIGAFTKQKGSLFERERVMFQNSWTLAFLIDDRESLNANIFSTLVMQLSITIGVYGNGDEFSVGDEIAVNYLETCHPILVQYGFVGVIDRVGYVKNIISLSNGTSNPVKGPEADKPDDDQGDNDSDERDDSDESDGDKSDGQGQESGSGQGSDQGSGQGQGSGNGQDSRQGPGASQGSGQRQ